jgi:hypothetical protein
MRFVYIFLVILISNIAFSQTMMVVERPGTVKNYIFEAGQYISLKTKDGQKINGPINIIRDSSLVVNFVHELELSEIEIVYKPRYLLNIFGTVFIGGSVMYLGLDAINGGMKGKNLKKDSGFLVASSFIASGIIMKLFSKKKMHIDNDKWRIKILKE